jgi:hypothetical protein
MCALGLPDTYARILQGILGHVGTKTMFAALQALWRRRRRRKRREEALLLA